MTCRPLLGVVLTAALLAACGGGAAGRERSTQTAVAGESTALAQATTNAVAQATESARAAASTAQAVPTQHAIQTRQAVSQATARAQPTRDTPVRRSEQERIAYNAALLNCAYDPEQVYNEADTRSAQSAAQWYAKEVSRPGEAQKGSYEGCLDGLMGRESRY